jgi:hypothetical protein
MGLFLRNIGGIVGTHEWDNAHVWRMKDPAAYRLPETTAQRVCTPRREMWAPAPWRSTGPWRGDRATGPTNVLRWRWPDLRRLCSWLELSDGVVLGAGTSISPTSSTLPAGNHVYVYLLVPYCAARTVRWSNFDRRDAKMGVFLRSTEATPCGHVLKWKLTPEIPPADTMFMAAMAMVLPWKIVKDYQSFVENTKL